MKKMIIYAPCSRNSLFFQAQSQSSVKFFSAAFVYNNGVHKAIRDRSQNLNVKLNLKDRLVTTCRVYLQRFNSIKCLHVHENYYYSLTLKK